MTAGNGDGLFAINAGTGEVTVVDNTNLNHETTDSYVLTLTVGDGVNTSGTETLTLNVTDVNEFAPVVNDQSFNIPENSANSTSVGTVAASDADTSQTLTYAITAGNTNSAFALNSSTGEITVNDVDEMDRETTASYRLIVQVTDSLAATRTDTATVTVNNAAPTVAISGLPADNSSPEGAAIALAASVSDPGSLDTFTYHWTVTVAENGQIIADGPNTENGE